MENFNKAYDEVKDIVKAKAGPGLLEMSTEEFGMVKAVMNLSEASLELTRVQAETINNINKKLDALLELNK
jgi:hypothetical protein